MHCKSFDVFHQVLQELGLLILIPAFRFLSHISDPASFVPFSDLLYGDDDLDQAFANSLGDDGILVVQIGEGDEMSDPPSVYGLESRILAFRKGLEKAGFESVTEYVEAHAYVNEGLPEFAENVVPFVKQHAHFLLP
jgi:hypothetical protein